MTKLIKAKDFQPKPGDHWLDITNGMSGYFVVELWLNPDKEHGTLAFPFVEPYDTPSRARHETAKEAWEEAKSIAKDWSATHGEWTEIPLIEHPELEKGPKAKPTDYGLWLEQLDSHQPNWWLDFATQQDLAGRIDAMQWGGKNVDVEHTKTRLRERVGARLFVAVRAWVSLEICPICQEPIVLAKRVKEPAAERGATRNERGTSS